MPLNDQLLAHHISTVKHGAEVGNTVKPYLDAMKAIVRKSVAGFDSDKRTRARLEKLLEKLAKDLEVPAGEYRKELIKQLREFARYEARYQADTIGGWVNVNLVTPTVEQVWAAAKFEPLKLAASPIDFDSLINSWGNDEVSRLVMGVKSGFVEGLTTRQIIKNVVGDGGLADISQRNAMANGRTLVMHLANEARFATYQENDDVVIGYTWVSTLDSRTSDICRSRDGQVYLFKDKNQPKPPAHYNCLSGDTVVSTCSPVSNMYKRAYKGVMVKITTKSGRTMTITPNHPVLTSTGWVTAGELDLRSQLVCCNDIALVVKNQKDCVVTEFSKLFSALNVSSDPVFVSNAPTSTKDFHGDVTDSEVNIISVDSESWGKVKTALSENVVNDKFPLRSPVDFTLPTNCGSMDSFIGENGASDRTVSVFGKRGDLLRSASCHSRELLLTSVSKFSESTFKSLNNWGTAAIEIKIGVDSVSSNSIEVGGIDFFELRACEGNSFGKRDSNPIGFEHSLNWLFTAAEQLPDFIASNLVDGIELDDVIDISLVEFNGHVYNLENENNWYLSNGIITHNCRSTTAPKLSPEFDIFDQGATRASKGADGGKQVAADTTYYDWLKRQPASYQDEVLGKTKGLIFRNSGIDAEEFRKLSVGNLGRPLTIDEMAAADKRVAEYLRG